MLRSPANVHLMRAQVILIMGALIPTILTTPVGIILLASGDPGWVEIVAGVLVLSFAASSVTGFIIGGIYLRRGSAMVNVQHDFLSVVSHELRTPMTAMRMFVEALLDDRLTDASERAHCLRVLGKEIDRMDGLVDRLIQLSRLETDSNPYTLRPTPLDEIVKDALSTFKAVQALDQTGLEVDLEPDLYVIGDHAALVQVLVNLLSNAWKYADTEREIHFTARALSDREVEIVVQDNGPEIPPDELRRMFETFWRGRRAIETGSAGSGLGLAIVKGIVKAHGGKVDAHSSPNHGTSVHVRIPRGDRPDQQ